MLLDDRLLQPTGLRDGHAARGDARAQGMGARWSAGAQRGDAHEQGRRRVATCGGRLRVRPLPGRGGLGPQEQPTHRIHAESPLHADPGGAHLRREHQGRGGPQAVRVPGVQEAATHGPNLHHGSAAQERAEPRTLDKEGRGTPL